MKKGLNPIQCERKPSLKMQGTGDLYKAFSSIEEEILSLQSLIEKNKLKHFPEIYRVRSSRSDLHPISKLLGVCGGETPNSLQQHRNSVLVEPTYHLLSSCLGPQYSSLHPDTALRLLALKSKFQEILFKKISESFLFVFYCLSIDTSSNEIIPNIASLLNSLEIAQTNNDKPPGDLEIQNLKQEITKKDKEISGFSSNFQKVETLLKEKEKALELVKNQTEKYIQTIKTLEKEKESFSNDKQDKINTMKTNYETQINKYQEEIKELKNQIENEKEKHTTIEQSNSTNSNEELNALKEKYDSLATLHDDMIKEKDTLILNLTDDIQEIQDNLNKSSIEIQTKQLNLQESSDKFGKLQAEYKLQGEKYSILLQKFNNEVEQNMLAEQSKQSAQQDNKKLREFLDASNEKLQKALQQISSTPKANPVLDKELATLKHNLASVEEKCAEKTLESQELSTSLKAMTMELKYMHETNDRLQDQLAKLSDDYDEDTFEHVMRYELYMMREAYEKKIKMIRQEHEDARKKILSEVKNLKSQLAMAEHAKDMAEFRLNSFKNI